MNELRDFLEAQHQLRVKRKPKPPYNNLHRLENLKGYTTNKSRRDGHTFHVTLKPYSATTPQTD